MKSKAALRKRGGQNNSLLNLVLRMISSHLIHMPMNYIIYTLLHFFGIFYIYNNYYYLLLSYYLLMILAHYPL